MEKKGEMTTQQIVVLIILIASFAVILFFLAQLRLGEETDREICHNSVIARANIGKFSSGVAESIPLDCKRKYLCISEDGSCEALHKPQIEKVKTKTDVFEVLADDLANCWWMFGEGKINYVGKDMTQKLYCSQCSQIAFDDSVKKIFQGENKFNKKDFYEFLTRFNWTEDQSYFEYLFGSVGFEEFSESSFGEIDLDSQYYSVMAITSDIKTLSWVGVGVGVAAGLLLTPVTGGASLFSVVGFLGVAAGGTIGGVFLAPVVEGASGNQYISPSLVKVGEEYNSLNCDEISTLS